jgi:hypothetical protein
MLRMLWYLVFAALLAGCSDRNPARDTQQPDPPPLIYIRSDVPPADAK